MKIVVTGAGGFVGKPLCAALHEKGYQVIPVVRCEAQAIPCIPLYQHIFIHNCDRKTQWRSVFNGVDIFIHLLACAHKTDGKRKDQERQFQETNVAAFEVMIKAACCAQVKQVLFLSSIKVNGESTPGGAFNVNDIPQPEDSYGRSKHQAEQLLKRLTDGTKTRYTILRPPLVFGCGQKGNLQTLEKITGNGWPLPLGGIENKRSLIGIDNLLSVINVCLLNTNAYDQTFLVADEMPVSTSQLISLLSPAYSRCFKIPLKLALISMALCNKKQATKKLFSDLEVDSSYAYEQLGWRPVLTTEEGFRRLAHHRDPI